jgi:hypothetical protein
VLVILLLLINIINKIANGIISIPLLHHIIIVKIINELLKLH